MARLRHNIVESDDDFESMMQNEAQLINTPSSSRRRRLPLDKSTQASTSNTGPSKSMLVPRTPTNTQQKANRVRLLPISALQHTSKLVIKTPREDKSERKNARVSQAVPLLKVQSPTKSRATRSAFQEILASSSDEESDVEESILCQPQDDLDASENEVKNPEQVPNHQQHNSAESKSQEFGLLSDLTARMGAFEIFEDGQEREPEAANDTASISTPISRPGTSSDKENDDAILQFSPDRSRKPAKKELSERPVTPPVASLTKSRLQSPSKKAARIPTPPARPSLDQFWNVQTVNEWNDQHSPQKPLTSPRKPTSRQESSSTSSVSPQKSPQKSTKSEAAAALKSFHATKHALATAFLAELDATITANQISALTASTGGVQLIWSKTLNSTAGRANWRRETTTRTNRGPTVSAADPANHPLLSTDTNNITSAAASAGATTSITHKHFASIELAEKVISDPARLRNVLAHEFCHLANFMISGIKDQPHGASFQAWGQRCTRAFGQGHPYEVRVTTKHAYEIAYRYVWRCGGGGGGGGDDDDNNGEDDTPGCGREYARHSKSIDPRRHTCGVCRGKLVQVKPVPRGKKQVEGEGGGRGRTTAGVLSGYAAFVKMHFAAVKRSLPPGTPHKEVMEALGKKYRAERAAMGDAESAVGVEEDVGGLGVGTHVRDTESRMTSTPDMEHIADALEVVVLSDDEK